MGRVNSSVVMDASALLAYLHDEAGADVVTEALVHGAAISAANWAEVLSKIAEEGEDPEELADHLQAQGFLGESIEVIPLTDADARLIARLRPATRVYGLSLGDRACIALGLRLGLPVLTADRTWAVLDLGVTVQAIR